MPQCNCGSSDGVTHFLTCPVMLEAVSDTVLETCTLYVRVDNRDIRCCREAGHDGGCNPYNSGDPDPKPTVAELQAQINALRFEVEVLRDRVVNMEHRSDPDGDWMR